MNTKGKTPINESQTKLPVSAPILMRWAGVSAMVAGLCFIVIGIFHPVNVPSAVTTATWVNVNILAFALGFFGLFGMAGLYARQAKQSGWVGLAGFVLLSCWITLQSGFSFVEAFILPRLTTDSPAFVAGYLGMSTGIPSEIDLGILPTLWTISNPMYLFGPLLFGIATFRAGILPRWAGALLIVGAVLAPISALAIPPEYQATVMVPIGLALTWLGYALLSERREKISESLLDQRTVKPVVSKVA
jgi:hypothetical protein